MDIYSNSKHIKPFDPTQNQAVGEGKDRTGRANDTPSRELALREKIYWIIKDTLDSPTKQGRVKRVDTSTDKILAMVQESNKELLQSIREGMGEKTGVYFDEDEQTEEDKGILADRRLGYNSAHQKFTTLLDNKEKEL